MQQTKQNKKFLQTAFRWFLRKSNRWFWLFPLGVVIVSILQWAAFYFNSNAKNKIVSLFADNSYDIKIQFVWLFLMLFLAGIMYLYIDYRQHAVPLSIDFPKIRYNLMYHMKVVVLPRMKYNWRRSGVGIAYGLASLFILSAVSSILLQPAQVSAYTSEEFVTIWKTDNLGSSSNNQIIIPTTGSGYNYTVAWEEVGNSSNNGIDGPFTGNATVTFPSDGTYEVRVTGAFPRIYFYHNFGDRRKLLSVEQWGSNEWTSMAYAFNGASNLVVNATDAPDLSNVTDMSYMFRYAGDFNSNINHWDVSNVTNMGYLFSDAISFDQPLDSWVTNNVTNMNSMFSVAHSFNQPLNDWDVSSVTGMSGMFFGANSFNQPLNDWDVSSVTSMASMFYVAGVFNQPLNDWDVSNVTNMSYMFASNPVFNQPLDDWDVSSVTTMENMFDNATAFNSSLTGWNLASAETTKQMFWRATAFNQPINDWNVGNVINMDGMFRRATVFNQALSSWDVQNVTNMNLMFSQASTFNSDISTWSVSNVTDMSSMFSSATSFNQPLNSWDVSSVTSMHNVFNSATSFNQPLSSWDVSNVTIMGGMFQNATSFNQPLNSWEVDKVTNMVAMFQNATTFNQHLSDWNTSSVTNMRWMFSGASSFNRPLNSWNTGNVEMMDGMFRDAASFSQPLNSWDVSRVIDMTGMFSDATSFNGSIGSWNTESLEDIAQLFSGASSFNQNINSWDVSGVTYMNGVFSNATSFNQPLSDWDMSSVTNTGSMFAGATSFNQPLNGWNVSSLLSASQMFSDATSFNQPLSNWNTSNLAGVFRMFMNASVFNQSLSSWDVEDVYDARGMLSGTKLSVENYDATLVAWSEQSLKENITLGVSGLRYCSAEAERAFIITNFSWIFSDDSKGCPAQAFVTTWRSNNTGVSGDNQIIIPTIGGGYNYVIEWENDSNPSINGAEGPFTGDATITFPSAGTYRVSITGGFPRLFINAQNDRAKLLTVEQWGDNQWTSMERAFSGASNLTVNASDTPDLSSVESMAYMFSTATSFNSSINNWDVSNVTNMSYLFHGATSFDQPLNNWDVSNVTNMMFMFAFTPLNQPLNSWEVSSVTNMSSIFYGARAFNQPLDMWDVSSATSMNGMFLGSEAFNQNLDTWDTGAVTNMNGMFYGAINFDQSLASWDVSKVTSMADMFSATPYFDSDSGLNLQRSGLSTVNYDDTLTAWSQQPLSDDVVFGAGTSVYCNSSSQRQFIIDNFNWTINDNGENCNDDEEPTDPETPGEPSSPTRPTTPPSIDKPDELPVAPGGEGEQSGVAERMPEAETEDEPVTSRDEDELESEPVDSSTTPRRPGGEEVAKGQDNFVARTLYGVAGFFNVSPRTVVQALPWLFVILLIILALVALLKVIHQLFVIAKTRKLTNRQALLNHQKKSLISLATHHLRTPLTILASGIEMLPKDMVGYKKLSTASESLRVVVDKIVHDVGAGKGLADLTEPNKAVHKRRSLIQAGILVPVGLALFLVAAANIIAINATSINPGWLHIGAQISGVILVAALLYLIHDQRQRAKELHEYEQQLLGYEEALDITRNQFIKSMAEDLVPAVITVGAAIPGEAPEKDVKFIKEGIGRMERLAENFILISQLEKQALKQRATELVVQETVDTAQQNTGGDIKLSNTVPRNIIVHQPRFLLHKVFSSLIDNANTYSPPENYPEVIGQQKGSDVIVEVKDYGVGIPPEKLALLFRPLSRLESAEDFTHQGLGLSLYVNRLVMSYLGGNISAKSRVGKGTTMKVSIPKQLTA